LGNLRVACRCAEVKDATKPEQGNPPIIVQQAHYDPWGVKLPMFTTNGFDRYKGSPEDRFKYNGKEQQPDISYYDYGARMYDPTVGRWFGVDPMTEADENFSPYQYGASNPISNIDLWGLTDVNGDGIDDGKLLDEVEVRAKRSPDNNESRLDNLQLAIDGVGWVPGLQTVAGLTNAAIDVGRGKYGSALFNLGTSIPVVGYFLKGAKVAAMTTKVVSSMAKMKIVKSALVGIVGIRRYNGVIKTAKYSQWTTIDGYQIHHIIPQSLMDKPIGRAISKAGFDIDAGDNLRYLEKGFHSKHGTYTTYVREELQSIINSTGTLTISDINGVINNMQGHIDKAEAAYKASGTTLNNFFK